METQIQEIERLNQIEKQKELIAELPEMIKNIDLPDRVLNDLFWAERYRLEHNLPCWFMTIPEPTNAQAMFISTIVGAGAAFFGLYVGKPGATIPVKKK